MLSEIELEALHCLDRASLEGLQTHSRYLRDLVNRHARTLPLRHIYDVTILYGYVYVHLLEDGDETIEAVAPDEQALEMLFHLLNNAFIHRLTLTFRREDFPLPYYLRANADDLQCQIGALQIQQSEDAIDYALVDFLGVHLKPTVYKMLSASVEEDYVMLFKHDALRDSVSHLKYDLAEDSVPDYIVPEFFGVDVVESCGIITGVDPRPWIGKFVQMFEMAEPRTDITLLYERDEVSLLRLDVEPLGQPLRTDVPTPQSVFVEEWSLDTEGIDGYTTTESTTAELFVFENAKSAKKLEVLVWTVEEARNNEPVALQYAFLLRLIDE